MTIEVSVFHWPPFAQGYVGDLRVRWAPEEAGLPCQVPPSHGTRARRIGRETA